MDATNGICSTKFKMEIKFAVAHVKRATSSKSVINMSNLLVTTLIAIAIGSHVGLEVIKSISKMPKRKPISVSNGENLLSTPYLIFYALQIFFKEPVEDYLQKRPTEDVKSEIEQLYGIFGDSKVSDVPEAFNTGFLNMIDADIDTNHIALDSYLSASIPASPLLSPGDVFRSTNYIDYITENNN